MPKNLQLKFDGGGLPIRHVTRRISVGTVPVGGNSPITVQSMTNSNTSEVDATLSQINTLYESGCDIVRCAIPDQESLDVLPQIIAGSPIPVVADIHFDYKLAIGAIEAGIACVRINPGTMPSVRHRLEVARAAAANKIPVRIGLNSGSIERSVLAEYGGPTAAALVASALKHCAFFEKNGCSMIKVSLKSSNVPVTVAAYRLFAEQTDYPLHLGITEAGTFISGTIKSAAGIGCLLLEGIGDTLRISLTAPPEQEVIAGQKLLEAVGLREAYPEIISCPTCGRTKIDLLPLVEATEKEVQRLKRHGYKIAIRKIAIMGCVVNGPGEAREADLGIAGGNGEGVLFRHGKVVRKLPEAKLLEALLNMLRSESRK